MNSAVCTICSCPSPLIREGGLWFYLLPAPWYSLDTRTVIATGPCLGSAILRVCCLPFSSPSCSHVRSCHNLAIGLSLVCKECFIITRRVQISAIPNFLLQNSVVLLFASQTKLVLKYSFTSFFLVDCDGVMCERESFKCTLCTE